MNEQQRRSWDRIAAFRLDEPGARFPFTARLARENRWSLSFARRVTDEYRRFLFLAVEAGHPVTPSDQVDQVWHLHLTYTESYWGGLCRDVLGRPLHHGPTRGGAHEAAKFHDWYGRTLDSYRRLFGTEPPADIWPPAAERFGRDLRFARVNTATHWVIPRPATILHALVGRARSTAATDTVSRPSEPPGTWLALAALTLLSVASVALAGCQAAWGPALPLGAIDLAGMSGSEFLGLFVPLTIGAVVASVLLRLWLGSARGASADAEWNERTEGSGGFKKLDPYALILLARGPAQTEPVQAALARLVGEGRLTFDESTKRLTFGRPRRGRTLHPVEQAVLDAVRKRPTSACRRLVRAASRSEAVRGVEDQLRAGGWVRSPGQALAMRVCPLLPLALVLLLGLWRIGLGVHRGRPVGYLVLLCIALGFAAALHAVAKPWRTARGGSMVDALGSRKDLVAGSLPEPADPQFLLAFALLGLAALPGTGTLAALRQELLPPTSEGDGGGWGGGDGGGNGGGGGGGCGGCGG